MEATKGDSRFANKGDFGDFRFANKGDRRFAKMATQGFSALTITVKSDTSCNI